MSRAPSFVLALVLALPVASQGVRRPRPKPFPVSVSAYGSLNTYGTRAQQQDALLGCTSINCIDHGLTKGPGGGVEIQLPLFGTLGLGIGAEALSMHRSECIQGGNCAVTAALFGLRGRAELLVRLKARAPIYFGFGAAGFRTDPGAIRLQDDPTIAWGGVFTIGGDFRTGPRTAVRVVWNSFFLKADDTGLPTTYTSRTSHDGSITVGVRYALVP